MWLMCYIHCFIIPWICFFQRGNTESAEDKQSFKAITYTRQCAEKFRRLGSHSACATKSDDVIRTGINPRQQRRILRLHNKFRGQVDPPAVDMMKMWWDEELAEIAQAWADTCSFRHDKGHNRGVPGSFYVGQNLCYGHLSWKRCVQLWFEERGYFHYNASTKSADGETGHYTQLVWAQTHRLGCGRAVCAGRRRFMVCNYAPGGNTAPPNTRPYKSGSSSCSDCPQVCRKKLCDCGPNTYCENGGTLNPDSCTCTCTNPMFQIGKSCKLDCDKGTEAGFCDLLSIEPKTCQKYFNLPFDCPHSCGMC